MRLNTGDSPPNVRTEKAFWMRGGILRTCTIYLFFAAGNMESFKPVKQHILWKSKSKMLQSSVDEREEENILLKQQLEEKSAAVPGL